MKISNNRTTSAWFNYRANGAPMRVYLQPFETFEIPEYNDVDQSLHHKTISNFSDQKPLADSGITTNTVSVRGVAAVNSQKGIEINQQLRGNFEIKYRSQ